jgi:hypothetical protein
MKGEGSDQEEGVYEAVEFQRGQGRARVGRDPEGKLPTESENDGNDRRLSRRATTPHHYAKGGDSQLDTVASFCATTLSVPL